MQPLTISWVSLIYSLRSPLIIFLPNTDLVFTVTRYSLQMLQVQLEKPKLAMMLPDPARYTPSSSRPNTPPMFSNNNSKQPFSLPPIRELLKDAHGQQERQSTPQSPGYFYGGPQQFPPMVHSHYPQPPLGQRPLSPLAMNTPESRSQSNSPISYEQTTATAPVAQQLHPMAHQLHIQQQHQFYEQQRQKRLELDAQMTAQRATDSDSIPKEVKSGRKKRQNLPRQTTLILLSWLSEHLDRPYPNSREKYDLLLKTRLTIQQLDNWFINARRRKIGILRKLKENDQSIALSL